MTRIRLTRTFAFAVALVMATVTLVVASHLGDGKRHRIVYQLDDPGVDKARFVLNDIANHVKGVGGWNNVEALELVVFGPALKHFVAKDLDAEVRQALEALPQGGVVRVMELQEQGFSYIRP